MPAAVIICHKKPNGRIKHNLLKKGKVSGILQPVPVRLVRVNTAYGCTKCILVRILGLPAQAVLQ